MIYLTISLQMLPDNTKVQPEHVIEDFLEIVDVLRRTKKGGYIRSYTVQKGQEIMSSLQQCCPLQEIYYIKIGIKELYTDNNRVDPITLQKEEAADCAIRLGETLEKVRTLKRSQVVQVFDGAVKAGFVQSFTMPPVQTVGKNVFSLSSGGHLV
ncbi:hypothetical protein EYZ11_010181 [Aspergillus tanneri]|uniref:Uncharacterized protein n=1 Tax=Aspergillus tanneri TaxID=1220188 RepID=A0A4S3J853_9EURO|nr:hypothetical protein EYZ11_010181 [Aspergillus tanneri]